MQKRSGILKNPAQLVELYNLDSDLAESKNLAAQHPDIADKLLQLMRTSHTPNEHYDWKPPAAKTRTSN